MYIILCDTLTTTLTSILPRLLLAAFPTRPENKVEIKHLFTQNASTHVSSRQLIEVDPKSSHYDSSLFPCISVARRISAGFLQVDTRYIGINWPAPKCSRYGTIGRRLARTVFWRSNLSLASPKDHAWPPDFLRSCGHRQADSSIQQMSMVSVISRPSFPWSPTAKAQRPWTLPNWANWYVIGQGTNLRGRLKASDLQRTASKDGAPEAPTLEACCSSACCFWYFVIESWVNDGESLVLKLRVIECFIWFLEDLKDFDPHHSFF